MSYTHDEVYNTPEMKSNPEHCVVITFDVLW